MMSNWMLASLRISMSGLLSNRAALSRLKSLSARAIWTVAAVDLAWKLLSGIGDLPSD